MSGSLANSPADVIRYLLIALGLGTLPTSLGNWPISISKEPDTPDNCVTIYDTTGIEEGREQVSGKMNEHEGVQLRIRATDYLTGYQQANTVKYALDTQVNGNYVTIGSSRYLVQAITRTGSVIAIGKEIATSAREIFTINAIVAVSQLS